jgi:hypothetical protein
MKGFRISSLEKDFFVETELPKAGRGDLSKGARRLDVSFEIEALCLEHELLPVQKREAPF